MLDTSDAVASLSCSFSSKCLLALNSEDTLRFEVYSILFLNIFSVTSLVLLIDAKDLNVIC